MSTWSDKLEFSEEESEFLNVIVYGGGIYNKGTLAVSNSTFSGNSAVEYGGGIINDGGTITMIANSTFSGNSVNPGNGGGIANFGTITTIANSTFSGNSADYGGGIYNNNSIITTIANSTFSGNWSIGTGVGGIYNETGATITTVANTIIANSPSGDNCGGDAPGTSTNNLTDSAGCDTWGWTSTLVPAEDLGSLADNGGPTQTSALLYTTPANPAIDGGDASTCLNVPVSGLDQRGVTRPTSCDIGAYEFSEPLGDVIKILQILSGITHNQPGFLDMTGNNKADMGDVLTIMGQ